ncbi:MAG: antibiotic biosynthesis monooxygenase [Myxococcales bacterium]|jgi:heme-degrading monooxygenase HmoA|nr:antibiotic biosynthesis monooxygenase [Myxococcales bacterium]MBL0195715.1 antibiotic biosynthesis monooxygenase [Myxococcales bacterium]HQY64160.1 antibiotic biosynthesis monooxygenase [Polyangiaceae bacterium]
MTRTSTPSLSSPPSAALAGRWPLPYYAVIFTSVRAARDEGYGDTANRMLERARTQPGFLGIDSARDGVGITVSYWQTLEAIAAWKRDSEHLAAQEAGRRAWYVAYNTRVAKVEREYDFAAT